MDSRGWMPIETAPKDEGEDILVARFDEDGSYWAAVAQWYVQTWAFAYHRGPHMALLCFEPTHWMPLPPPPAPPAKAKEER